MKIWTQAAEALRHLLLQVPAAAQLTIQIERTRPTDSIDLVARILSFGQQHELVAEIRNNGEPRHVRAALLSLHEHVRRHPGQPTPLLIAPYLSARAQELCRQSQVGYLDFEGNAWLAFGTVLISCQSATQPVTVTKQLRSLFKPKSAQVLKVLLRDPSRAWRVAELAQAANVSLGHVSNVRRSLLDREWAELSEGGMHLRDPDALLDQWRDDYEAPVGEQRVFYTTLHGTLLEAALKEGFGADEGQIALASFSAAQWLAPFARTGMHYFYADDQGLRTLQTRLQLSSPGRGENIVVNLLDDPGLFLDTVEPAPGLVCTSPVQTYLDLAAAGERGREAAGHLRQQRLRWQG